VGGTPNLGVFCEIKSINHGCTLIAQEEALFIHIETQISEEPHLDLVNGI
jgi:hypothetical protein